MHIIANKRFPSVVLKYFCLLLLCICPTTSAAAFEVPERLEYAIWWEFVKAGNSVLEITDNGDDTLKIVSTAKSSKFLSVFYKVEDRIEVNLERDTFLPYDHYMNLREGRNRKEKKVTFDRNYGKIILDNIDDMSIEEFQMEGDVFDPLSAFYLLRKQSLKVGQPLYVRVFDNGKLYEVEVEVLKKETVKVPAGTFKTIKVKPLLKSDGIFMRKGEVIIWLTDDENRIPVKMKSKVKIGAVSAVLKDASY